MEITEDFTCTHFPWLFQLNQGEMVKSPPIHSLKIRLLDMFHIRKRTLTLLAQKPMILFTI